MQRSQCASHCGVLTAPCTRLTCASCLHLTPPPSPPLISLRRDILCQNHTHLPLAHVQPRRRFARPCSSAPLTHAYNTQYVPAPAPAPAAGGGAPPGGPPGFPTSSGPKLRPLFCAATALMLLPLMSSSLKFCRKNGRWGKGCRADCWAGGCGEQIQVLVNSHQRWMPKKRGPNQEFWQWDLVLRMLGIKRGLFSRLASTLGQQIGAAHICTIWFFQSSKATVQSTCMQCQAGVSQSRISICACTPLTLHIHTSAMMGKIAATCKKNNRSCSLSVACWMHPWHRPGNSAQTRRGLDRIGLKWTQAGRQACRQSGYKRIRSLVISNRKSPNSFPGPAPAMAVGRADSPVPHGTPTRNVFS